MKIGLSWLRVSRRRAACFGVVLLSLVYGIFLHYAQGMDAFWDTANYHIFVGWAALNLAPYDYGAAAQFHTYLNPVIDMVNYKMFTMHPYVGGAFHVLCLAMALLVCYLLAAETVNEGGLGLSRLLAVAIGATGVMTVSLFGSFTNEHVAALFVLVALYKMVVNIDNPRITAFLGAGVLMGVAVGLKLTALSYAFGLIVAVVLLRKFDAKAIIVTGLAIGFGVLIADGPFMVLRYEIVENPVFPLANNIFKSPYFPVEWKSFSPFQPERMAYYLSLPFVWLNAGDFSEARQVRDGRFLLAYAGLALLIVSIFQKKSISRKQWAIVVFYVASWVFWILLFRIYRYLVALELLSGIIFLIGLSVFFNAKSEALRFTALFGAICFLMYVTVYPNWGRRPWQDEFVKSDIAVQLGKKDNHVVLFADQRSSYLAPELSKANVVIGNMFAQPWYDSDRQGNPIDPNPVSLTPSSNLSVIQYSKVDPRLASPYLNELFGDRLLECVEIHTNMIWSPYLCTLVKPAEVSMSPLAIGKSYKYDSMDILFLDGWSSAESGHRWSDGLRASLLFKLRGADVECRPKLRMMGYTLGQQSISVSVNGTHLSEENLAGEFELSFSLPIPSSASSSTIRLALELPNATSPNSGDTRTLAIALRSLQVDCDN